MEPHSPAWYDQLAKVQQGYYYPWKSKLSPFNGEDAYLELVKAHLTKDSDVLDSGCGHGDVALQIAPLCRSVFAYDRVEDYIALAQTEAKNRAIENVTFICANSSASANAGKPRIPSENRFDLLISRRGPLHWIEDIRRVAKLGATLIMLNPLETPLPVWHELLPEGCTFPVPSEGNILEDVKARLAKAGLELHSYWTFDVPEVFENARELYRYLTWGNFANSPSWEMARPSLEGVFVHYATQKKLTVPHRRLLWKATLA